MGRATAWRWGSSPVLAILRALWMRARPEIGSLDSLEQIEAAALALLADIWSHRRRYEPEEHDVKITRMLVSGTRNVVFTGTQSEVEQAAARLSHLTGACVSISVIVAHYHRRGCVDRRQGGYQAEGN